MAIWRSRSFLLILLLSLLGLAACDRLLPGTGAGNLPTAVPTAALGGVAGDPDVGGGQGEVEGPLSTAYPPPAEVPEPTETSPREADEPANVEKVVEPTATVAPKLPPTPSVLPTPPAESEMEEEIAGEPVEETASEEDVAEEETVDEAVSAIPPAADLEESSTAIAANSPQTHTVAAGENLYRIGLQYGLSWLAIARANDLTNADRITVGQVLLIPAQGTATPGTGGQPTPSPQTETTHTVRPGDNLFRIGLAYGVGWVQIAEANGLVTPGQIYVGQVLKIPVSKPGPTPEFTHQVRPGETLRHIASLYGIPWTTIAQTNNLDVPYVIHPGQTLIIPGQ